MAPCRCKLLFRTACHDGSSQRCLVSVSLAPRFCRLGQAVLPMQRWSHAGAGRWSCQQHPLRHSLGPNTLSDPLVCMPLLLLLLLLLLLCLNNDMFCLSISLHLPRLRMVT